MRKQPTTHFIRKVLFIYSPIFPGSFIKIYGRFLNIPKSNKLSLS